MADNERHNLEKITQQAKQELEAAGLDLKPSELPKGWHTSPKQIAAIKAAVAMNNTKHGLYAAIPMLCKGEECPYAKVCPLINEMLAPTGERCPLEIAIILRKYKDYKKEFEVDEDDIIDMNLIKDMVDLDVQMFRAENKMAIDGDFVEDIVVTVTDSGEVITNPQLSKASEYKDKVMKKKHEVMKLMHSTRSDKAGDKLATQLDPSTYAAQLMAQAAALNQRQPIDGEFTEVDEDNKGES